MGPEIIKTSLRGFYGIQRAGDKEDALKEIKDNQKKFFKDFYQPIDKQIFISMCETFNKDIPEKYHPSFFADVKKDYEQDVAHL